MNSLWNFDDVFALSQENEVHIGGGAAGLLPATPARPAPSRSYPTAAPVYKNECLLGRQNWPELGQSSNGYLHEIANSSNSVQASIIPYEKPSHTVEFFGLDCDYIERNQLTNQNSGPYTQALGVGSPAFGTGSLSDILASGDAAFIPSVEASLTRSFEMETGALDLNFPAVPGGWRELNAGDTTNATEKSIVITDQPEADCLYETPAPSQVTYDLNLTPRREVENTHTSGVSQHMQLAPITPDLARSGNPQLPIVYSLEDESINQEKSSKAEKSISLAGIEAENNENNELQNVIENGVEEGIDLNRTPQQRAPKRKKHRPKVIIEGKAKKTKTSQTLEKPTNVSGNPSGKRKYVRKKSLNGTPMTPQAENGGETEPDREHTSSKSAKRALNFDLEEAMEAGMVAGPEQTIKHGKTAEVVHPSSRTQTREPTTKTMAFFGTGGTLLPEVAQQNRFLPRYQQENIISSASASTGRNFAPTYSLAQLQAAVHQQSAMNGRRHGGDSGLSSVLLTNSIIGKNSPTEQQINNGVNQPMLQSNANSQNVTNSRHVLLNRVSQAASNVARDQSILNGQTPQSISTKTMWQQILSGLAENQREASMKRISHASPIVQDPRHNHIRGRSNDIASTLLTAQMSRDMPNSYGASELNQVLRNGCYLHSMALHQQRALFEQQAMREKGSMLDLMRGLQSHPQQQLIQAAPITPAGKQKNTSLSATTSPVQNKQEIKSKRNAPKSPAARKGSTAMKKEMALSTIDEITRQLSNLYLEGGEEGAIVPYKGDGTIVPFEGKKRKLRPKVDLDPETDRVWNLLMGKENGEGLEENNQKTEKWWENEREVFRGRADSFIARMHLVQGDRRFSRWKGSVVDSVIGVFLTQNVSDVLSSSAFISLAAHFPVKLTSSIIPCDSGKIIVEEPADSTNASGAFDSCTNLQLACNQSPVAVHSTSERWRDTVILVPDRNVFEMQTHCSEEAISSQGSFDCSAVDGSGGFRSYPGSNSESEDLGVSNKSEGVRQSTSRTATPGEKFMLQDVNIQVHGNISPNHVSESAHEELNDKRYINGSSGGTTPFAFESRNGCTVPLPASLYHLQMSSEVQVGNYDVFGEDITSSLSKASTSGDSVTREENGAAKQIKQPSDSTGRSTVHEKRELTSEETQTMGHYTACTEHQAHQKSCSKTGSQSGVTQPSQILLENTTAEPSSTDLSSFTKKSKEETKAKQVKPKRAKAQADKKIDWDYLRKDVQLKSTRAERSEDAKDSLDYEAMREASIKEISETIKERGMNNMLAERIKEFLNRLVEDHGSIDLEWLRDVPPDKAKDYLLSIRGLGLKSVECVRLLTLHHLAFPVDTNVGRIAVRLGWVPLQPLPESVQLHLLELYPVLESVQKYLWPRLCKLDQRTLYELHYQLITFGKVFCTKSKPNCNACPMRGECRHFASAFASARLALPGPGDKSIVSSTVPVAENNNPVRIHPLTIQSLENHSVKERKSEAGSCKPIIEEPASPEQECIVQESDIEDGWGEDDDDEIPTIKLNMEEFTENLQNFMQGNNMELQDGDMSKALVALNPRAACIPTRKLKNVSRLRTEHQVYELPDDHPLLEAMIKREPDDPSPYLLAIWTPGETADSVQPPEQQRCQFEDTGCLCNDKTCFSCSSIREANSQTVRGTLLIPCRTAMRGSFPLNGTYFQVNEMFADHDTSLKPIDVPRNLIWNLRRRTVYFGTSVTSIFRGLTTEEIQFCFWKGFVCVRGFEQGVRTPRPLVARLHLAASKVVKTKDEKFEIKGMMG